MTLLKDTIFSETGISVIRSAIVLSICWTLGYFSFSICWIGLFTIFVGIFFFLWRKREIRRLASQFAIAQEREAILACLKDLPYWVEFFDSEKVEWLNKITRQAWSYINHYAIDFLKEAIELALRENMPTMFSGIRIEKMDFGKIPLRIESARVLQSENPNRVMIDMDVKYEGDCEVILAIKFMRAGVQKVTLKGKLRVVLAPLAAKVPIVEAMAMFFLNQPSIDFDLTQLGNVLELPALSHAVKLVVEKQICDMCVVPNQIVVPLSADVDAARLYTQEPDGVVRIHILEARNLENRDIKMFQGLSDPYVKVSVGSQNYRSRTIDNDLNPIWDEHFEAVVYYSSAQKIELDVFDEDPGLDDFLGSVSIDLANVKENGSVDQWYHLSGAKTGEIHVVIFWLGLIKANIMPEIPRPKTALDMSTAIFMAYVDKAHIEAPRGHQKLSSTVQLIIGDTRRQTYPKPKSSDPSYQEKFYFFLTDVENEILRIQVNSAHDRLAHAEFPLSNLLEADGLELYQRKISLETDISQAERGAYVILTLRLRFLQAAAGFEQLKEKMMALPVKAQKRKPTVHKTASMDAAPNGEESKIHRKNQWSLKKAQSNKKTLVGNF